MATPMGRLVTQPEVLRGLESLGIVYIVTSGCTLGDYVNYPVGHGEPRVWLISDLENITQQVSI